MTTSFLVTQELVNVLWTRARFARQNVELTRDSQRQSDPERRNPHAVELAEERAERYKQDAEEAQRILDNYPGRAIQVEANSYFTLACFSNMGACVDAVECYPENRLLFFDQARRFLKLKNLLIQDNEEYTIFSNKYFRQRAQNVYYAM